MYAILPGRHDPEAMDLSGTTLRQRHHAAVTLAHSGQMDGDLALSFVIWPNIDDIPRDLSLLKPLCSARHGNKRCGAPAEDDKIGLCADHLWAYFAGEDFDFWGEQAA